MRWYTPVSGSSSRGNPLASDYCHWAFSVKRGDARRYAITRGSPQIDSEQEYFADGIVEEIITALSRFGQFFVIARNSSFTYKGRAVDIKQVGRELGLRYVLEGSVRKSGNRVRSVGAKAPVVQARFARG